MKKLILCLSIAAILSTTLFVACSKDNNDGGPTTLKIRMTDAPFNADSINVDIREVRVKFRDDSSSWMDLATVSGVYDLLGLQNGVDTLLATGVIPTNSVKEIRFVLGSANSIVINNVSYPLTIPSGAESGLKLKVNKQLNGPIDSLLIDFDAALSIHQNGNGGYMLKPVLKIK